MKNTIDHIEIWPDDPESYIRRVCEQFGLPPPISFTPGRIGDFDNLVLDAKLADGRIYRLAHSPIQDQRGAIVNRKRTEAEIRYIHRVRSAAGRAGANARWGDGPRATACVRLYPDDAKEIQRRAHDRGVRPADVVAELLRG